MAKDYEELKREHAETLGKLRSLHAANPDLEGELSPDEAVFLRESRKARARKERLYRRGLDPEPPEMDLDDAVASAGVRDPEDGDVRELGDLSRGMTDYNRAILALLREMQDVMMDGMAEIESMRARFARMR